MDRAYFVYEPRRIDDLTPANQTGRWMTYRVVGQVYLSKIDFENFTTDLLADRQFIEDHHALCTQADDCLLVKERRKSTGGLLIIPWHGCFVKYAARVPSVREVE